METVLVVLIVGAAVAWAGRESWRALRPEAGRASSGGCPSAGRCAVARNCAQARRRSPGEPSRPPDRRQEA